MLCKTVSNSEQVVQELPDALGHTLLTMLKFLRPSLFATVEPDLGRFHGPFRVYGSSFGDPQVDFARQFSHPVNVQEIRMKELIERYKQHIKKNQEWAKEHPGAFLAAAGIGMLIAALFGH